MKRCMHFFACLLCVCMATPSWSQSQKPLCTSIFGKSISVSGKITSANVADGVAKYDLSADDSPCMSLYFSVVDPRGQIRCKKGQRIKASGTAVDSGLGANLSSTDYSCQ
jgi:hypothetical protein